MKTIIYTQIIVLILCSLLYAPLAKCQSSLNDILRSNSSIKVYPSPVENILKIDLLVCKLHKLNFKIMDMLGHKIIEGQWLLSNGTNNYGIDLRMFCTGIYILSIANDQGIEYCQRIIKK